MFKRKINTKDEKGQNLVELAVLMPVFILLLAGLLDVGRAFNAYMVVINSAREAARYGSQHPTDQNGVIQQAQAEAQRGGLDGDQIVVGTSSGGLGQPYQVQVSYPFNSIIGDVVSFPTITLRTQVEALTYGT